MTRSAPNNDARPRRRWYGGWRIPIGMSVLLAILLLSVLPLVGWSERRGEMLEYGLYLLPIATLSAALLSGVGYLFSRRSGRVAPVIAAVVLAPFIIGAGRCSYDQWSEERKSQALEPFYELRRDVRRQTANLTPDRRRVILETLRSRQSGMPQASRAATSAYASALSDLFARANDFDAVSDALRDGGGLTASGVQDRDDAARRLALVERFRKAEVAYRDALRDSPLQVYRLLKSSGASEYDAANLRGHFAMDWGCNPRTLAILSIQIEESDHVLAMLSVLQDNSGWSRSAADQSVIFPEPTPAIEAYNQHAQQLAEARRRMDELMNAPGSTP